MMKMVTPLTVLAFALGATPAMAGGMDWSFYGKLHTSINLMNDSEDSQLGLSSNTSRFGFKGDQELNENLTFIWQFENSLNIAQRGGTLAGRSSFLGLKGTWGTAQWGIHESPYYILGRRTTYFNDSVGDNRQVMMHTDNRRSDYLMYLSPDLSGFGFQLGYEFDQNDAMADNQATSFAGMAHYATDAFFLGVAYETLSKGMFDFVDDQETDDPDDDVYVNGENAESRLRFAGKYDTGKFGVALIYQMLTDYDGIEDWKSTTLGGELVFHASEKFDLKGGYHVLNPDTEEIAGPDGGCSLLALGIDYNYVKNVQFYLQYAGIMNEDNGTWGLGDNNGFGAPTDPSAAADPGATVSGFSFGTTVKW
ncbi:MAG: porin [Krumholzibacteria bacterium]|nr:porin [Candidatus Krumholzibacteria bacterium]